MAYDMTDNRYRPSEDSSRSRQALAHIRGLIGADAFKAWVETLEQIRPTLLPWRSGDAFPVEHLMFAIDPGNGLTTVLKALHAYLAASGLFHGDEDGREAFGLQELRMAYSEHLAFNRQEAYTVVKDAIEENSPALISLDMADWMERFDDIWFQRLLDVCVHHSHDIRFVFVVPILDDPALERIRKRLSDRLPIMLIRFPQPDPDMLFSLLRSRMKSFGFSLPETAAPLLQRWIYRQKGAGRYHGMRTLDNLADELAMAQATAEPVVNRKAGAASVDLAVIQRALSLKSTCGTPSAEVRLAALAGMDSVRRQLLDIAKSARLQKDLAQVNGSDRPPCLHMMFTGNPGTGKTEVARIVGQLFREEGLLPNGELLEVNRFDLVGQYVGQTGPKTISACRSAYGSILFIDEAYLLSIGVETGMSRDYGQEAIGALIAEMENSRDRLIVILAGYREEMERFLAANPGLSARIPHRLHFPSYDRKTLAEIFLSMVQESGGLEAGFQEQALAWFAQLPDARLNSPHFGNARFARNLAERVHLKSLLRQAAAPVVRSSKICASVSMMEASSTSASLSDRCHDGSTLLKCSDFTLAVADPDILRTEAREKCPIGFSLKD